MMKFARRALIGTAVMAIMAGAAVAQDYTRIRVHNGNSEDIVFLYSKITSTDDWGDDMLGDNALPEAIPYDDSIVVDVENDETCLMDFRAEFRWGGKAEVRNVNVCTESLVVFPEQRRAPVLSGGAARQ